MQTDEEEAKPVNEKEKAGARGNIISAACKTQMHCGSTPQQGVRDKWAARGATLTGWQTGLIAVTIQNKCYY